MRFSRLSPEVDAEIRRRLEAGDSIGAIVRALHVSRASVTLRKPRRHGLSTDAETRAALGRIAGLLK